MLRSTCYDLARFDARRSWSTARTWCSCTSGTDPAARRRDRRAPRAGARSPPALPRHAPPGRHRAAGDGGVRPRRLRRRARLRRRDPPTSTSTARLGRPGLDVARGGRRRASSRRCRGTPRRGDLVWIGNWGDGERTAELREFLIEPVAAARAARAGPRRALPAPRRGRRWTAPASVTAAGSPTTAVPEAFAAPRGHRARAAPAVRAGAARHPDHPPVRGDGLRRSRWSAPRGTTARACSAGHGPPRRPRRPRRWSGSSTSVRHDAQLAESLRAAGR